MTNDKEEQLSPDLVLRHLTVRTQHGSHSVRQLHYTGWPDHGVPSGDSMEAFQMLLDEFLVWLVTSK